MGSIRVNSLRLMGISHVAWILKFIEVDDVHIKECQQKGVKNHMIGVWCRKGRENISMH